MCDCRFLWFDDGLNRSYSMIIKIKLQHVCFTEWWQSKHSSKSQRIRQKNSSKFLTFWPPRPCISRVLQSLTKNPTKQMLKCCHLAKNGRVIFCRSALVNPSATQPQTKSVNFDHEIMDICCKYSWKKINLFSLFLFHPPLHHLHCKYGARLR
jgi:hypothetical protein